MCLKFVKICFLGKVPTSTLTESEGLTNLLVMIVQLDPFELEQLFD
jgi:hypothetical protein